MIGEWHPGAMLSIDNLGKGVSSDSWTSVLGKLTGIDQRAIVTCRGKCSSKVSWILGAKSYPATQPLEMSLLNSLEG